MAPTISTNQTVISPQLRKQIQDHEGGEESAYQDSEGWWTIAYGRLIDKRKGGKLSQDEMNYLLNNDLLECIYELHGHLWYFIQDDVRKGVLIELAFSMGLPHLLEFKEMITALSTKDYQEATNQLLDSKWATKDVGHQRVKDVTYRLLKGVYP